MENSLNFTSKIVREDDFDYSLVKSFLFLALNFLSIFLGFYYFKIFLNNLIFKNLFISFILFSLFFIFSLINVFIIKSTKKLFWFSFLTAFLSFFIFFENYHNLLLIGAFIFFIFLFLGFKIGNDFLKNSLKIKFFNILNLVIKKIIFGFLIFLLLIFSVFYFDFKKNIFNEKINQIMIENFIYLLKKILNIYFDVDNNLNLREIIKNYVLKDIRKSFKDSSNFLPQLKEKILIEEIEKYKINLEEKFKIKLDLEKNLDANLKINIFNYFNNLENKNKFYFVIIFLICLFILLNIIFKIFSLIYIFITFIFYKLLILTGFIQISLETRSREFLIMK